MTGDLNLIRDEDTRVAIVRWVGWAEQSLHTSQALQSNWLVPTFREMVRMARPAARGEHPFTVDHRDLLDDPDYFTQVTDLQLALVNERVSQENTLEVIRATREIVERSLHPDRPESDDP